MSDVVVIGAQWGDEGKGKIVDWLSARADVVVRFQGGHNAGHTLVTGGKTYKLSLLPSGVIRKGCIGVIGSGVVVDPSALLEEIGRLSAQGVHVGPDNLVIAENASLILPLHRELDTLRETSRSGVRIGTTGRGIGPAYEDRAGRRSLRIADLADPDSLPDKVDNILAHHNVLRRGFGVPQMKAEDIISALNGIAPDIVPFARPVWRELDSARKAGKRLLFEGAQGVLLDVDHGTYPFVTSSSTVAGQAATGSGVGPGDVGYVLGLVKAYTTRVGSGPFPTELDDETGRRLGETGREFGVVTGRKRRCGWFDAALVRQSLKISGVRGIALTKLDVLDGFDELKICTGYDIDGCHYDYLPAGAGRQSAARPVYETLKGWSSTTRHVRSPEHLPAAAWQYIRRIEELVDTPVVLISTSPDRDDVIIIQDPFS